MLDVIIAGVLKLEDYIGDEDTCDMGFSKDECLDGLQFLLTTA